jgi:ubiquinone/menaquinone biosynthesis C-methylase UbiE
MRDIDALTSFTLKHLRDRWWDASFTAFLQDALLPQAGERVLDVGCGTGTLLRAAGRRQPGAELIGADPDPAVLRRARRKSDRAGLTIRFERAFADELPLPDDSVDVVLSSFMLHHVPQDEKPGMMRQIRRVLRPGGRLHLVDVAVPPAGHRHPLVADVRADLVLDRLRDAGLTEAATDGEGRFRGGRVTFYRARG